ncbi:MAG: hypothetical protein QXW97_00150 [Candidatus Pacearchaeota archaeon]
MKKGVKKNTKNRGNIKYKFLNENVKKSLPFRLLIIFMIILIILVVLFIIININTKISNTKIFIPDEENLGTLSLFNKINSYSEMYEKLNEIHSFTNENKTAILTLSRTSTIGTIKYILIIFNRTIEKGGDCYYSIETDFPDLNPKTYTINIEQTNCGSNFTYVFNIIAIAIINQDSSVNLTQIKNIPDYRIYVNKNKYRIIDLKEYFKNLVPGDEGLSFSYLISTPKVEIRKSEDFLNSRTLDFYAGSDVGTCSANITLSYPGVDSVISNNFNIEVISDICSDSDNGLNLTVKGTTENSSIRKEDECYNITHVREYFCSNNAVDDGIFPCSMISTNYYCNQSVCIINTSQNRTPIFIYENCDIEKFTFFNNVSLTYDISNCFKDPDGDSLIYKFSNNNTNIKINLSGSILTITPLNNWFGSGNFYIYANDSLYETRATINFLIKKEIISNKPPSINNISNNSSTINYTLKIKDPVPNLTEINESYGKNMTFMIGNSLSTIDSIKWYLDNKLINENSTAILISDLSVGNHILEVQIRKGIYADSKIWKINITEIEKPNKFVFKSGKVILYLIFVVIIMIIIMIIWIFVQEYNRKHKNSAGLDLSSLDKSKVSIKNSTINDFNIPSR